MKPAARALATALLAGSLLGCLPAPVYTVTFPPLRDGGNPLPVELVDESGLVVGLDMGAWDDVPAELPGARAVAGAPNIVAVDWMGGMCDERTTLTLVRIGDRLQLTIETEDGGGGCRLAGISRSVKVRFRQPIDSGVIDVAER